MHMSCAVWCGRRYELFTVMKMILMVALMTVVLKLPLFLVILMVNIATIFNYVCKVLIVQQLKRFV